MRSENWSSTIIADFLKSRTLSRIETMRSKNIRPLLIWDGSVLEKHESMRLEGLSPVISSKAKRLTRIQPGYYNSPVKGFINVP